MLGSSPGRVKDEGYGDKTKRKGSRLVSLDLSCTTLTILLDGKRSWQVSRLSINNLRYLVHGTGRRPYVVTCALFGDGTSPNVGPSHLSVIEVFGL